MQVFAEGVYVLSVDSSGGDLPPFFLVSRTVESLLRSWALHHYIYICTAMCSLVVSAV